MDVPRHCGNAPACRQGACRKQRPWRPRIRGRHARRCGRSVLQGEAGPGSAKSCAIPKAGKDFRVRNILPGRRSGLPPERLKSASASGFRLSVLNVCLLSRPVTAMVTHCRHALDRRTGGNGPGTSKTCRGSSFRYSSTNWSLFDNNTI